MNPEETVPCVSRRTFLRATAAAVAGLALPACRSMSEAPDALVDEVTRITGWFVVDPVKAILDDFHQRNPTTRMSWVKYSIPDLHMKLLTALAAGAGAPDVSALNLGFVASFTAKGGLVDLLQPPFDGDKFKEHIVDYKWVQGSTPDGRLVAMPTDIGPGGLWYRADLFEAAGLEADPLKVQARIQTWEDWFQLGEELKTKTPQTRLIGDAFFDLLYPMIEQQGHGWFEGNRLLFVEKGVRPLQRCVEARKRGIDADISWGGAEWANGMKRKAFAGIGAGCWMQFYLQRDHPDTAGMWRVIRAPEGNFNWAGSFLCIPEQSSHQGAAWEFIKFLSCTIEGQHAMFQNIGAFPAYKPMWKEPVFDQPVDFFGGQKVYRLWLDIADELPALAINPHDRQAEDIVNAEFRKVEKEGKDPVQAMNDAEAEALKRIPGITS